MGSLARTTAGIGAIFAATALTAAPAAQAQSAADGMPVKKINCDTMDLVSAIGQANAGTGPGTLRLAPRCTYDIASTLPITNTRTVTLLGGPSTAIRRNPTTPNTRIFDISVGATLRAQGIYILNGKMTPDGGGIRNAGYLELNHTTLTGNVAALDGGGVFITPTGRAWIAHSLIDSNIAGNGGFGGGIYNQGTLTLFASRLTGNNATFGGGIFTSSVGNASTKIIQSTLDKNTAATQGGGIYNNAPGKTSLFRTLVVFNTANADGGGINNAGAAGDVILRSSIVRRNNPTNCSPPGTVPGCLG
jgi:hypothetical protein